MERLWEDREVLRFSCGRKAGFHEESLILERPLTVYLNGSEVATLLCTPSDLEDLALGFLFGEGLIESGQLDTLQIDPSGETAHITTVDRDIIAEKLYGKRTVTSGCGAGTSFFRITDAWLIRPVESGITVRASDLAGLMEDLGRASMLYKRTRGAHAAASAVSERILVLRDDIGRHNAVDKVAGDMLRTGWDPSQRFLLVTGRVSSEMVIKAARMGCPIIASRASPTSLAVRMAEEVAVTVVGYARGGNFSVFSRPERVEE